MSEPPEEPQNGHLVVSADPACIAYLERTAERIEKLNASIEAARVSIDAPDALLGELHEARDSFIADHHDLNIAIALRSLANRLRP